MGTTVRGTTQKGVRLTHTPSPLPSNGPAEPGLGSGPGSFGGGGDNVKGSAGNAVSSNMGPTGELPAAGKTPTGVRSTAGQSVAHQVNVIQTRKRANAAIRSTSQKRLKFKFGTSFRQSFRVLKRIR